jgi:hypothetical protein
VSILSISRSPKASVVSYPNTCLSFAGNAAGLVNQFALPIALEVINWKTYFIYMGVCFCQAIYYYIVMVETKGHTLEELNVIFQSPNPRKAASLPKHEVDEEVNKVQRLKQLAGHDV